MNLVRIYLGFAAAYLLSYLFRMVNAVISPELTRDLELSASALGLLTAAYPIAFMSMQLPLGLLIDRFGPRNVETALLLIAASGAVLFGFADSPSGLFAARAMIGVGVSACLMAPLTGFQRWYPPEKRPAMTGWIMAAAGTGAVFATTPVEWGLSLVGWRGVFWLLGGLTFASALLVWRWVPPSPPAGSGEPLLRQLAGVARVYAAPRFWRIAPVMMINMGLFMAIQGLWSVPWMMQVDGQARSDAAGILLAMSVVMLAGFVSLGVLTERLARAGISHALLFAIGMAVSAAGFAAIALRAPLPALLAWALYGGGVTVSSFAFNLLAQGVPLSMVGRATTALNLLVFLGSVASQWGIGLVLDWLIAAGATDAAALSTIFQMLVWVQAVAYAWFLAGWKEITRQAAPAPAG